MQLGPDSETYGKGCCVLALCFLFVPAIIGTLYSFGLLGRRHSPDEVRDLHQGD